VARTTTWLTEPQTTGAKADGPEPFTHPRHVLHIGGAETVERPEALPPRRLEWKSVAGVE